MKLLKFPVITHVIKAVCGCGTEFQYAGFSTASNPPLHAHVCTNCGRRESLKSIYPKHVHEQSSVVGDEVEE